MFFCRAILTSIILFATLGTAQARELQAIFVASEGRSLEPREVREIIKSNQLTWANGQNILLIIDELDSISEEEFQDAFKIKKSKFLEAWRIKFFSGRALSPLQVKTAKKGLTYVEENPNSLFLTFQGVNADFAPKGIVITSP